MNGLIYIVTKLSHQLSNSFLGAAERRWMEKLVIVATIWKHLVSRAVFTGVVLSLKFLFYYHMLSSVIYKNLEVVGLS